VSISSVGSTDAKNAWHRSRVANLGGRRGISYTCNDNNIVRCSILYRILQI
jgi:hypothetical protein